MPRQYDAVFAEIDRINREHGLRSAPAPASEAEMIAALRESEAELVRAKARLQQIRDDNGSHYARDMRSQLAGGIAIGMVLGWLMVHFVNGWAVAGAAILCAVVSYREATRRT